MDSNEEEGVCYPQPVTLDDRVRIARDFVESCDYEIPIAIDPPHNPADELYAAWPERFYIVDADGTIAYKGETGPFGYHPDVVAAWLLGRFERTVLPPSDVPAERIEQEPLSVRAVEYDDSRESWRIAIDPAGRATVGRGEDARTFDLEPDRARELRRELAERGFFGWTEATGWPNLESTTRCLVVQLGDDWKIVTRYAFEDEDDDDGEPSADRDLPEVQGFERIWGLLRGLDAP